MSALLRYDAARRALSEAVAFDEVKDFADRAEAMRIYARQAGDVQLEQDATEIRLRAVRRFGQLEIELKAAGLMHKGGRPAAPETGSAAEPVSGGITLADLGVGKKFSSNAQAVGGIAERAFEALVARKREEIAMRASRMIEPEPVNGARAVMGSRIEPEDSLDFLPTPPWATRALMEGVFPSLGYQPTQSDQWSVWEPACGEGHMAEVLKEYFRDVYASDIFDHGYCDSDDCCDFLNAVMEADWIITNPPFDDNAEKFAARALELARIGVAIFVPLRWLETIGRYERLFSKQPPTLISFFAERVNLCKGRWDPAGSTATAYIWLVWVKGQKPRPPFWIPPGQREALTCPDDEARFTAHPVIKRESLPPHDPETGELTDDAPQMGTVAGPATESGKTTGAGHHPSIDDFEIPEFLRRTA